MTAAEGGMGGWRGAMELEGTVKAALGRIEEKHL